MTTQPHEDGFYSALGERIRRERTHTGFTQAALARAVEVSQPTISDIESGQQRASVYLLALICEELECDLGHLVAEAMEEA